MIIAGLLSILSLLGTYIFSIKFPPSWSNQIKYSWIKINILSLIMSIIPIIIIGCTEKMHNTFALTLLTMGTSFLTYTLIQCGITDTLLRLADRRIINALSIIMIVGNSILLNYYHMNSVFVIYVILLMVSLVLVFLPFLMGASDGRALLFAFSTTYPALDSNHTFNTFKMMIIITPIIALTINILNYHKDNKNIKIDKNLLKGYFLTNTSLPLVPIILSSFLIVLYYYSPWS